MKEENIHIPMGFWTTGEKYWNIVDLICDEIIRSGNTTFITSEEEIASDEAFERTKRSDLNLVVPLLFNFYHGLELILKGFIIKSGALPSKKIDHNLSQLIKAFRQQFPQETNTSEKLEKYVIPGSMPNILREFFEQNKITPDQFYLCLKYPYSRDLSIGYDHSPLTHKGEGGVEFYGDLKRDISEMMPMIVELAYKNWP